MFCAQSTITVRSGRRGYRRERKLNELNFIPTLQLSQFNGAGSARNHCAYSLPLPILWSRRQRPSRMAIFRPWSGSLGLLSRGLKMSVSRCQSAWDTHSGHRFRAPSSKEGCRKLVLGVCLIHWPFSENTTAVITDKVRNNHVSSVWHSGVTFTTETAMQASCQRDRPSYS